MPDFNVGTQPKSFFETGAGQGVLAGLGGLAGLFPSTSGLTGSGTSTTNTSGETNTNFNQSSLTQGATNFNQLMQLLSELTGTTTTTPTLTPGTQALIDKLTAAYGGLAKPVDLSGYQATQVQGINRNADLAQQAAANIMASRGLSTSPAGGTAAANIDANRFAQINQLNQSLPLLQNELTRGNLAAASSFIPMVPYGTTTSTQQQQGQQQQTAGGTSNVQGTTQAGTGYSATQGAQTTTQQQNQNNRQGGGVGGAIGGIASVLASLFSDERLKDEIQEIPTDKAVRKIMALKPSSWKWKGSEVEDTGLIAQELKNVMPELVNPDEDGINRVNYAGLIGTLVSAVQGIAKEVGVEA